MSLLYTRLKELGFENYVESLEGITGHNGRPALVRKRYAGNPKDSFEGGVTWMLLNMQSINDLQEIRTLIINAQIEIDDIQFLIAPDGKIVISDPGERGISLNTDPEYNIAVVDKLIGDAAQLVVVGKMAKNEGWGVQKGEIESMLNNSLNEVQFRRFLGEMINERLRNELIYLEGKYYLKQ